MWETDYVYWESGVPVQGASFSTTSAGMKIGQGIASALVGWALALGSYIPNSTTQPATAIFSMKFLYIYFPLVICIVMIIVVRFIDLENLMPDVRKAIKSKQVGLKR